MHRTFGSHRNVKVCGISTFLTGLTELYVFAYANSNAYGAVAYLLWPSRDIPKVRLGLAKARVASLRRRTIPRLDFIAAFMRLRHAKTINEVFKVKPEDCSF